MHDSLNLQEVSASTLAVVDDRIIGNVGVVVFSRFIALIDTGRSPYAAKRLRNRLEATYRRPVTYACVTHYHPDHTGGLSAFKEVGLVGSARVAEKMRDLPGWCRAEMAAWSEDEPGDDGRPGEIEAVVPSLLFDEEVIIAGDKCLKLRACGGHSDCSVYAYLPEDKVLFSGDLISVGRFPFAGDETVDPEAWIATLRQWLALDIEHVIPGHGPVASAAAIGDQLSALTQLKKVVTQAVQAGKGAGEIVIPEESRAEPGHEWFDGATAARWHAYYYALAEALRSESSERR